MQNWIEIRVLAPAVWAELVADVVGRRTGGSVVFGRPNLAVDDAPEGSEFVRGFIDAATDSVEQRSNFEAELHELAVLADAPELRELTATYRDVPPEDWETSWRKSWKPFRVGRMAVITHDWDKPLRDDDVALRLEPAGAFGTGRHATTRRCLHFLQGLDLAGKRVLDCGTGTGILSVAAALLGAESSFGFDIDERSKESGESLARRNGVESRCRFATGGFEHIADAGLEFDVALANIYFDVIEAHARDIAERLVDGAPFAFSGCPADRRASTEPAIRAAGFKIQRVHQRGRWLTFTGKRP